MLLNIIPGKSQFSVDVAINALNVSGNSNVYHGKVRFHKKIFWLINSRVTLSESTLKREDGMLPLDGVQGGIYDIVSMGGKKLLPYINNIKEQQFSFIPTVSALALNKWEIRLTNNLQGQDLFAQGMTDFEYTFHSASASEIHTTFNSSNQFLINQLKDKPLSPNIFQSVFCGNQTVALSNPQNVPLTWSVSNSMFRVISPTNASATITSASTVQNAILSIRSANTFPLRKRLVGTCNLSILRPSSACEQARYTIENLPSRAMVTWSAAKPGMVLVSTAGESNETATFEFVDFEANEVRAEVSLDNVVIANLVRSIENRWPAIHIAQAAFEQDKFYLSCVPPNVEVEWTIDNAAHYGFEVLRENERYVKIVPGEDPYYAYGVEPTLRASFTFGGKDYTFTRQVRIVKYLNLELNGRICFQKMKIPGFNVSLPKPNMTGFHVYLDSETTRQIYDIPGTFYYRVARGGSYTDYYWAADIPDDGYLTMDTQVFTTQDVMADHFFVPLPPTLSIRTIPYSGLVEVIFKPKGEKSRELRGSFSYRLMYDREHCVDANTDFYTDLYNSANADDKNPNSFILFPNPATTQVTVQLQEEESDDAQRANNSPSSRVYEIQLWSATALLKSYKTDQSEFQIPVSGLAKGIYFIRVIKDGQTHTQKPIKN